MRSQTQPTDKSPANVTRFQGLDRRAGTIAWLTLFLSLALWVLHRLNLFSIWSWVTTADGARVRLVDTYATVDHPFHAARAETLRRSLADGEWLRWIGHHQGGYPVEFYPLGVAWLEVGIWALFLGALPMAFIHKVAVAVVFLLPTVGFALLARRDRLSPGVALLASAAHVSINGWWWSGGYHELVAWGLVTNVAAHVVTLFALIGLVSYLQTGNRLHAALAAGSSAYALYTNPRSFLPLAVVGIAAVIAVSVDPTARHRWPVLISRLAVVAGVTFLMAAPEIVALLRFNDLYYFVHYETYDDVSEFLDSAVQAVSGPVFVLGILGLVTGLVLPGRLYTRAVAVALSLYALLTAFMSSGAWPEGTVAQLELTRLMPFQRMLTLYLAALFVYDGLTWLRGRLRSTQVVITDAALCAVAGLVVVCYVIAPPSFIPDDDRSLYPIATAADPAIGDLEEGIRMADRAAPDGTAMLILGSTVSWHDQLWAPFWSDRPFFYDDWLWYWQTQHVGDYDPRVEHAYPSDESTLEAEYLSRHAIGSVVVTGEAKSAATVSPLLDRIRAGLYDVYLVRQPTTIVTIDSQNADRIAVSAQAVEADSDASGVAMIRRNWFPRWRATVNGEPVSIAQSSDGYMAVEVPTDDARLELTYSVDGWDWAARGGAVLGVVILVSLMFPARAVRFRPRALSARR